MCTLKKKSKNWEPKHLAQEARRANATGAESGWESYGIFPTFHPGAQNIKPTMGILVSYN